MWNRRKEDDSPAQRAASQLPTEADLSRDGLPVSTMSQRIESAGTKAMIGKAVVVKGEIHSREDLFVDGEVEGHIDMPDGKLTVGANGRVRAGIKARELVVIGTIHGNVDILDKTEIRKDAKLVGDIRTVRITIEDGAYFKGSIDIIRPEASSKAQGKPAASAVGQPALAAESKA